jgi:hypothetical protein
MVRLDTGNKIPDPETMFPEINEVRQQRDGQSRAAREMIL